MVEAGRHKLLVIANNLNQIKSDFTYFVKRFLLLSGGKGQLFHYVDLTQMVKSVCGSEITHIV